MGQKNLPLASGSQHAAAFKRCGWYEPPNRSKNHIILVKLGVKPTLSIPDHAEVKRALIQKQIRLAGLTEEEYLDYFHRRR